MDEGYSFTISESYSPKTIPMDRLASYISALARLLGESANVHLDVVEEGSVAIRTRVDDHARPKVRERLRAVRNGTGPADARKAYHDLDDMLRRDNAFGALAGHDQSIVIPFPGKRRPEPIIFGPFKQDGTVDGQVYRIEGKDETKHVGIRDGAREYSGLVASEEMALRLRHHLFGDVLRFRGTGSWLRHGDGRWELKSFRILDFEELDDTPLSKLVERLREVPGSDLQSVPHLARKILEDRHEGEAQ